MTISDLDYQHTIQLVKVTSGYTDQQTGDYIPGSENVVEIKGHLQEITAKELQRLPEGEYEIGDRRLYTDADVEIGDIIKVTESDGSTTDWVVKAIERKYHQLSKLEISRKSLLLKPKEL
jgi:hypothetical protein